MLLILHQTCSFGTSGVHVPTNDVFESTHLTSVQLETTPTHYSSGHPYKLHGRGSRTLAATAVKIDLPVSCLWSRSGWRGWVEMFGRVPAWKSQNSRLLLISFNFLPNENPFQIWKLNSDGRDEHRRYRRCMTVMDSTCVAPASTDVLRLEAEPTQLRKRLL